LPGLGQHSGDYHEFSRILTGRGIDVWTIDHVGHGMTEGEPGRVGPLPDLVENARLLTVMAAGWRARDPAGAGGGPVVLVGHSLGAVVAAETAARIRTHGGEHGDEHEDEHGGASAACAGLVLCGVPFVAPGR